MSLHLKEHQKNKIKKYISQFLIFCLLIWQISPNIFAGSEDKENSAKPTTILFDEIDQSYSRIKKEYDENQYKPAEGVEILLDTKDITASSSLDKPIRTGIGGNKQEVLYWEEDYEWFEWTFDIKQTGLYEIELEYYALDGAGSQIQRALSIDGKVPFKEANNISFYRIWKEREKPKTNNIGDEVWPKQIEDREWKKERFKDSQGLHEAPFQFYLTEGTHTIRLTYVDQPMAISQITIATPRVLPTYEQIKEDYEKQGYSYGTEFIKFQAEESFSKNDPTVRRESNSDPKSEPQSVGSRKLNVMGDKRWRKGNQSITWKFEVPEDGLYKITMRLSQGYNDGLPSYRQIEIDGQVPFKEMEAYSFDYAKEWRGETLANTQGEPYLFYLTKGEHHLTMTVKVGPIRDVVEKTMEDILKLSEITRKITMITGPEPDPNFEYELDRNIPGLLEDLQYLSERMDESAAKLIELSSKKPTMANNYLQTRDQLRNMVKDPDKIPKALKDLENAQVNLGTYILNLQSMPLVIDYFEISPPDQEVKIAKSNFLQRLKVTAINFITSFTKDYDSVGSVFEETGEGTVIDVWVSRGKEWGEIMKEMADEDFTPRTGISINLNVLPAGQLGAGSVNTLMLSITSGRAPDVALGVEYKSPVEFAFRDAVVDLTQFADYKEVEERFYPSIMIPYAHDGGIFALPETMDFTVLFYRKDIVNELGLRLPNTWEDVYQEILPKLYENSMNFCYSQLNSLPPLLFQHGGNFYKNGGTMSGLDSAEAYQAFKQWTELYTNYGIPAEANFFTRMRNGDMPMGVANYALYVQMSTSAPELYGRWDIAPIPGTVRKDGTVDRSVGSIAAQAGVIMEQSTHKEEAWEFLKWWTSEETQTRYGRELEALLGVEARWNTANKNAFENLPWDKNHLSVIKNQLDEAKEQPIVLGGYFTTRHIENAWNRVVLGNENVRDSLEQAVKDINKELRSKQEEYGYITEE